MSFFLNLSIFLQSLHPQVLLCHSNLALNVASKSEPSSMAGVLNLSQIWGSIRSCLLTCRPKVLNEDSLSKLHDNVKMTVFWVVAPCSLVEVYDVSEVLAAFINGAITHRPDGGTKYL
jgi:hypothetical protein